MTVTPSAARTAQTIDTHAHLYPERYLDRLEALGAPAASTAVARGIGADDSPADIARRLEMMDTAGVAVQVLSATPQLPQWGSAAEAAEAAGMINSILADVVAAHPDRFLALAALPLPHVEQSLEVLRVALDEMGMAGVALNTFVHADRSLTDEEFVPLFTELNRRGALVYIHPAGGAAGCSAIADHGLTWVNGAPMEDAIATLQLLRADYPNRFDAIRFHVAHLGGDLPFLAQRIHDNYEDWGSFDQPPLQTLRRMWFDAANFFTPSLALALQVYAPDRVMAGSDFPYFQDEKYTRAVSYIRDLVQHGVPMHTVDGVLGENARHLYGAALPPLPDGPATSGS